MKNEILQSIQFRDKLYNKLLSRKKNSIEKENCKINLDAYNRILKRDIREAKAKFYFIEFNKHKNSIKKHGT